MLSSVLQQMPHSRHCETQKTLFVNETFRDKMLKTTSLRTDYFIGLKRAPKVLSCPAIKDFEARIRTISKKTLKNTYSEKISPTMEISKNYVPWEVAGPEISQDFREKSSDAAGNAAGGRLKDGCELATGGLRSCPDDSLSLDIWVSAAWLSVDETTAQKGIRSCAKTNDIQSLEYPNRQISTSCERHTILVKTSTWLFRRYSVESPTSLADSSATRWMRALCQN